MAITKISPDVVDFDDGITISTADNTDTLTLTSTDADDNSGPNLNMYRNSSSAADADVLGQVKFTGKNDAGSPEDIVYGSISGKISDASDSSEDGQLRFFTMAAGTSTQTLTLESGNSTFAGQVIAPNGATSGYYLKQTGGTATPRVTNDADNKTIIRAGASGSGVAINNYANTTANVIFRDAGNVEIIDGNLVLASGHGIDFSATADGSGVDSSELFNDYEEGTFTPAFDNSVTVATANGRYTKIGRVVNFSIEIGTSVSNITGNVTAGITGLPYAVAANQAAGSCFSQYVNNGPFTTVYVYTTGPTVYLYEQSSSSYHPMQFSDMNDSSAFFYIQGTYKTS